MLDIISKISTIDIQQSFEHLIPLFGFETDVRNPVTSESMYNREASEFDYPDIADFNIKIIYSNYMDLTRLTGTEFVDTHFIEPLGYTRNVNILEKARLSFSYSGKSYQFTVERIMSVELDPQTEGESIRRMILEPYS